MAKRLALGWALILSAAFAFAGDVAQFVNLGFSPDSRYFMFGQFGILEKNSTPWADAYIVDVPANVYAPRGTKQFASAQPVEPGTSALGALLIALSDNLAQRKQYRIDHLLSGRLLYVLVDGAPAEDVLEFRDFPSGRTYKIALQQNIDPKAGVVRSSFRMAISVTEKDGKLRTIAAGNPVINRTGVKAYHIKQIILAPDGASLVFLIQREEQDSHGDNVRYMVETVRVN
jgi:predicted secreted protein